MQPPACKGEEKAPHKMCVSSTCHHSLYLLVTTWRKIIPLKVSLSLMSKPILYPGSLSLVSLLWSPLLHLSLIWAWNRGNLKVQKSSGPITYLLLKIPSSLPMGHAPWKGIYFIVGGRSILEQLWPGEVFNLGSRKPSFLPVTSSDYTFSHQDVTVASMVTHLLVLSITSPASGKGSQAQQSPKHLLNEWVSE